MRLCRSARLKEVLVLERVVDLGDRHGAAFEPAVEDVVHAPQRPAALPRRDGDVVDEVPVQVRDLRDMST